MQRDENDTALNGIPAVTVVIPTHNRSSLLRQAIDSVLAQEHPAAEVIVVDDASTDDTADVAASFGDRIRYVRSERNIERGAARNLGADLASSPMVAFLDSDDAWLPGKLAAQAEFMRRGVASVTGVRFVDIDGHPTGREEIPSPTALDERVVLGNVMPGSASSLVLPTDLFREIAGFPVQWSVQGSEDWIFLVKLHDAGHRVSVVPEPLTAYRVHAANSTADPERVAVSMWSAVEWLDRTSTVPEPRLRETRGRTATTIARGYAHGGQLREAARWWRMVLRRGTERQSIRAAFLVPASAARGFLRRKGV